MYDANWTYPALTSSLGAMWLRYDLGGCRQRCRSWLTAAASTPSQRHWMPCRRMEGRGGAGDLYGGVEARRIVQARHWSIPATNTWSHASITFRPAAGHPLVEFVAIGCHFVGWNITYFAAECPRSGVNDADTRLARICLRARA